MARGRKKVNGLYFGPEQEEAVVKFLQSDDIHERNRIYNKSLRDALNKMVESIIRRYKLYRKTITYEELHADTLSFLITKSDKFKPEKGKKAYSYYGTICKNHLLGLLNKDEKALRTQLSYEDFHEVIQNREELTYVLDDTAGSLSEFIDDISAEIKEILNSEIPPDSKKKVSDNERRVGLALIQILDNRETIFERMGSKKYNKNAILFDIREATLLDTKEIRVAMKRYKKLYDFIKQGLIEDGYL